MQSQFEYLDASLSCRKVGIHGGRHRTLPYEGKIGYVSNE